AGDRGQRAAQGEIGERFGLVGGRVGPDFGGWARGTTADVDTGGDVAHFALGPDVEQRIGDGAALPHEAAAGDLQLLPVGFVLAADIERAGGEHLAAGARDHAQAAAEAAFQAETVEAHVLAQRDGEVHLHGRGQAFLRIVGVEHDHVVGDRYAAVQAFQVDARTGHLHAAANIQRLARGVSHHHVGGDDHAQVAGVGSEHVL